MVTMGGREEICHGKSPLFLPAPKKGPCHPERQRRISLINYHKKTGYGLRKTDSSYTNLLSKVNDYALGGFGGKNGLFQQPHLGWVKKE